VTLRRRWTAAFVVGELVGFVPPALVGAALVVAGVPDGVLVAGLVAAGAIEGAVLGVTTGRVLGCELPMLDVRRWVAATAAGAAVAWLAGMGGSALIQAVGAWALIVVAPGLIVGLLAMGILQWRVLQPFVPGAARWVPVTAGAWLVGVMLPVVALSVVPNGWPPGVHVVVGVAAAVAMGATVGSLTGRTLDGLLASSRAADDDVSTRTCSVS
jgi:hypothetical protein